MIAQLMKYFCIAMLFLSCSGVERKSSNADLGDYRFVRVYRKDSGWEPEKNCRFVSYVKIPGGQIQTNQDGYDEALRDLRQRVHNIGGTVAKIRDFTESFLWANVYFCSAKYDKYQKNQIPQRPQ